MDVDRNNRLVPSRRADDAEMAALLAVLARHRAVLQFVPRFLQPEHFLEDLRWAADAATAAGVRMLFAGYELNVPSAEGRKALERFLEPYHAQGAPVWANFSARPTHVNMHFERSIMWAGIPSWHNFVQAAPDAKRSMVVDAQWRAAARAEWDACTYTLAAIRSPDAVARTGQHPSDVLADWLGATDLEGNIRTVERAVDWEAATAMVRSPWAISGASDAGAHVQMFSGAGDSTYLLAQLARDLGTVRLEEAVHAVTGKQAAFFGIPERGEIRAGAVADLAVFALDDLTNGEEVIRHDLPGGAWRYSRTPGGYRATIVAGTPTWLDGASTGARPATLLSRAERRAHAPA
jgi:N-acyl-D-aspartate/D-glutamate deacylase